MRDIVDRAFYATANWYKRFLFKGFVATWFKWIEWVTLTAALWVVAEKTGSVVVRLVAVFSGGIVFFAAWWSLERIAEEVLPKPSTLPRLVVVALTAILALIPFFVMHFIAEVIRGVLE